jgi:hypothetical protein
MSTNREKGTGQALLIGEMLTYMPDDDEKSVDNYDTCLQNR